MDRARKSVPTNTGEFDARIASLLQRIDAIQLRLVDVAQKQNNYLAALAVRELQGQKDRLATYQIQARFALASMYCPGFRRLSSLSVRMSYPSFCRSSRTRLAHSVMSPAAARSS